MMMDMDTAVAIVAADVAVVDEDVVVEDVADFGAKEMMPGHKGY